jgi:metallo-beta-lactamase family protein
MKITFLGAVEEVTGSRYFIEHEAIKILVECGMFQGSKKSAQRNMDPFPIDPKSIDAIVLTHAHIDHTGYIPVLVKNGFKGKIYCSKGTYALCSLLLVDSGSLQEGDAKRKQDEIEDLNHAPFVPLYTARDAEHALTFFQPTDYDTVINIGTALQVTLIRSGHILGSAFVVVFDGNRTLTFSGDLGRPNQSIMKSPPTLKDTDFLVLESTYGDRLHKKSDTVKAMGEVVNATIDKGGILVIPCFAVGRTEEVLYCLYQLQQSNAIPNIPIFLDSPMAIKIADFFCDYKDEYKISASLCRDIANVAMHTRTAEESKQIDLVDAPAIIIAGSGMADGGRVVFHLQRFISDPKNTVLFVGFQAAATQGNSLIDGARTIKIHNKIYSVQAEIKSIETFSAHADYDEILMWLEHFKKNPKDVFITHGDIKSAQALKDKIEERFGWPVIIPKYLESFDLV